MQPSTKAQAAPAAAPSPTATGGGPVTITTIGSDGKPQTLAVPQTRAEVQGLRDQRAELSDQLTSVSERRQSLAEEINTTTNPADRTGLEGRLKVLDQRIVQI